MGVEERRSSALKSRRAGAGRSACLHADAGRAISTGGCGLQCGGEGNGMGGGGSERDSSDGFYCFKIQLQPEGCSAESCGPTTPPFPLHPPLPPPLLPAAPREGAGGVPGPQAGDARRRRGRGGRGGSSRELKGLLGRGERVGVLREAGGGGGGSRVLILLKI